MTNADTVRIAGVSATRPGRVLAIVCAGIVLANLDLFIVNVALPDIARDFGDASLGKLSWILNGYAIVYAALLVFCGRLAERYPRNQSFLTGIALFTVASAACALAAFRVAWWVMAVIAVLGLIPLLLQLRWRRAVTAMEPA